eukprot:1920248-Pyramimonas_sp.AAC.1
MLLLWFAGEPPNVEDPKRQSVAQLLLEASDGILRTSHSDVAAKLKSLYHDEFEEVVRSGG